MMAACTMPVLGWSVDVYLSTLHFSYKGSSLLPLWSVTSTASRLDSSAI
jgi:hypothetical protein